MKYLSFCSLFVFVLALYACGGVSESALVGEWIQPIPGMENQMQGIKLEEKGKASSINMHTLVYEQWEYKGEKLLLSGKSIGNGQTISFTDELSIKKLTKDSLVLQKENLLIRYKKK